MEKLVKIEMTSSLGIRPAGGGPAMLYGPGIVEVPESVARKIVAVQGAAPPVATEDSQGFPLDPDERAKKLAETAKRDAKPDKEEAAAERDSDKALREAQANAEKAEKEKEKEAAKAAKAEDKK